MAMQILKDTFMPYGGSWKMNGRYDHFGADGMERVREKQNVSAAETAKKAEMAAEEKEPGKLSEPQDEYISSEKSGKEPAGLYRVGRDETGSRKIVFDDPKAIHAKDDRFWESANGKEKTTGKNAQERPEICVGNTNAVDREIRKLKEKKQELEQQIQSASGRLFAPSGSKEERQIRELEKKLEQIEQELSRKDNDAYRKQHTVFSQIQ